MHRLKKECIFLFVGRIGILIRINNAGIRLLPTKLNIRNGDNGRIYVGI
jgi:hypothetical protein